MSRPATLVVNYNGGEILLKALAALAGAGVSPAEAVVVDNASTDGSGTEAARRFPGLTLLDTGNDSSFAAANNLGLRHLARRGAPESVLFLNNDAFLEAGAATTLSAALDRDPSLGAAAPFITGTDGRVWYAGGDVIWREAGGWLFGHGRPGSPSDRIAARVDFATLCVLLVRWSALATVGLLDETYRFYDEDLDLCLRLRRAGLGIAYEPASGAVHVSGHSTGLRGDSFKYGNMARNRLLTMRKHGTPARWVAFVPWFGLMMAWKSLRFTLRGKPGVAAAIAGGIGRGLVDPFIPIEPLPAGIPEMRA
jgi:N-acetylglucosaminyl-diphospho-decaprenol L-rhamnosyltransferase